VVGLILGVALTGALVAFQLVDDAPGRAGRVGAVGTTSDAATPIP
jgi:hypothetical protein